MRNMNTQLSIDCSEEMKKRVIAYGKADGRKIAAVVRLAIEEGLPILEARLAKSKALKKAQ